MNFGFCIIMSKFKLHQGLVLYNSLLNHLPDAKVKVLCIDEEIHSILNGMKLKNCDLIFVREIENEQLIAKKSERLLNEYCWTLKPFFVEHVFNHYNDLDYVTYLDADLCFFSDPSVIYLNQAESSILLTPHHFIEAESGAANPCGRFNSGFVGFKRDSVSRECLKWWKEKCLEWCFDRAENGKFGDQKYLEQFPVMFREASEVMTPGVNIAPWNQARYRLSLRNGQVYINSDRLIFYHFCGFRLLSKDEFALVLGSEKELNDIIYKPYVMCIYKCLNDLERSRVKNDYFYIEDRFARMARKYKISDYLGIR